MSEYKIDYCHHDSLTAQNTYIKREDAERFIERHCYPIVHDINSHEQGMTITGIKQALDEIPSADVVEVVRCKDCKHHEELLNNNDGNVLCWVHDIDVIVDRNGYCNYGEREEQEHE